MRAFDQFLCVDWSGGRGAFQKGIAVAAATPGQDTPQLIERRWSRELVLEWLLDQAQKQVNILIGFDFSFSLPFLDRGAFFPEWDESPADAPALWALIDRLCANDPCLGCETLLSHPEGGRHFRHGAGRVGDLFAGGVGRLRRVENICRAHGLGGAQSCFNLVGPAQVGKSSLTGMRMLHRLDGAVAVWPFVPLPARGPVLVEMYTTIAAREAGLLGRSKLRDAAALDLALDALGSEPHDALPGYDDHRTDALIGAAWLRRAAQRDELWSPAALDPIPARTEGWTFGVS